MSQKAIGGKSMSEESGRFGDGAKVDDSDNLQWSCQSISFGVLKNNGKLKKL